MRYSLDLLGQHFTLSVPFELHIGSNMTPFLRPYDGQEGPYHICVVPGDLPLPGADSIWQEGGYYHYGENYIRILRCQDRAQAPRAMVELNRYGHIRVTYDPDFTFFFQNASDLIQQIGLERLLLHHRGLILHASFIAKDGRGILFSAPSGTGKSTQANLWHSLRGYEIINGDRAGIHRNDDGWMGWGLPYAGSSGIYRNDSARICAIVVLRQGTQNRIARLNAAAAIRYLYPETTVHHWAEQFVIQALDLLEALVQSVPVYLLECLPDEGAVSLLEQTLVKEGAL